MRGGGVGGDDRGYDDRGYDGLGGDGSGSGGEADFWTPDVHWSSPGSSYRPGALGALGELVAPTTQLPRPRPPRRGRSWFALFVGVAATIALAGIGVVVLDLDRRVSATGDGDVVRLPVEVAGQNPFTPPLGRDQPPAHPVGFLDGDPPAGTSAGGGPRLVPADVPGRYAGNRDSAECGKELLVDYLDSNAVVAAAWTQTLGVEAAGFGAYADTLTPAVLRFDTLVTDHTFADGVAVPSVAVLQAGTAVLVDDRGLPVTRCFSGNPLTPAGVPPGVTYSGPQWPGFEPGDVVRLDPPSEPVRTFVLTDLVSGSAGGSALFSRPAGTTGADDHDFQPIAEVDFLTTTYDVGCGDPAGPVTISVTSGEGSVATGTGVRRLDVVDVVTADLTGDGAVETAVLLSCEPEDASYVVTEIQVFGDGPAILTTLTPPPGQPPLVLPYFTGDTFEVSDGRLRASARYYDFGGGDTLSSGPSVESVVTWAWEAEGFTPELGTTSTVSPSPRPRPSGSATARPGPGPSPLPSASASRTPTAGDCLDSDFVANWQGNLTQRQGTTTVSHQATVALSGGCVGDVVGSTYYLELDCGGTLTLVSGGDRPVFDERRTTAAGGDDGGASCDAERDLRLRRSGANLEVTAAGTGSSTASTTTGTLQRR